MKTWIPMLVLTISIISLCVWDGINTQNVFNHLKDETNQICVELETKNVYEEELANKIYNLNDYWTEKMDILCISISRKDLQIVSDYLQYLCASIQNKSQDDAITYSRLLNYNIIGLSETTGISAINLL